MGITSSEGADYSQARTLDVSYLEISILESAVLVQDDETDIPSKDVVADKVNIQPLLFLQLLQLRHQPRSGTSGLRHDERRLMCPDGRSIEW